MKETEEQLEDEELVDPPAAEEASEAPAGSSKAAPRDVADTDVQSIEETIAKKEAAAEEEDDAALTIAREERLEPLAVKVVPPQSSEFVCKKCYLVKHRSQLKDEKKMLCRDCA
jgi:hypothetical protein